MKEVLNPFESLHNSITTDSRDWAKDKKSAWIYGIIVGWSGETEDETEGLFQEFSSKFGWERDTWDRLQTLHKEYLKYKELNIQ